MKIRHALMALILIIVCTIKPPIAASYQVPGPVAPAKGLHAPEKLSHNGNGKVVIITLDRTSVTDWIEADAPNLHKLTSDYAIGLMNCKTGGSDTPENTYITIGSGVPLVAQGTSGSGFDAGEELEAGLAAQIYKQRTGHLSDPESIVQIDIARIHKLNEQSYYSIKPGTFGLVLKEENIQTSVLGNSDSISGLRRQAVSIAMDDMGIVSSGTVGDSALIKDAEFPGGIRTNYENILSRYSSLPEDVRLVVIDLGDFSRIEDARARVFDSVVERQREQTMSRFDNFLGKLLHYIDLNNDLLIITSPTPGGETVKENNALTPVLLAGNGVIDGLLYSPTTKRPGIIRNTDLLPTALSFMGINVPDGITGQTLMVMPGEYNFKSLASLQDDLVLINEMRRPILQNYILVQIIMLGAALAFIFWKKPFAHILKPFILGVMSVPVALLILPVFPVKTSCSLLAGFFGLVAILTLISIVIERFGKLAPFIFISGITSFMILIDLVLGAPLQKSSIFGYDAIMGARFYGLGNEYMGVLIGSTIIAATSLLAQLNKYKKILLPLISVYFIITTIIIAAPNLGTNVGGTISSVGAFIVTLLMLFGVAINFKIAFIVVASVFSIVIAFILYDINRPVEMQSHIGRTAQLIISGGITETINIIIRKLAINIKLIRYTIWSRVFLASLASLAILFYRPIGVMNSIRKKHLPLYHGFAGVIVGSILALIFNDSGIVAAATAMIFGAHPMVYLIVQKVSQKGMK